VGTRRTSAGLSQVTYGGQALYLDGDETPNLNSGQIVLIGSGNGKKLSGGSFHLVAP
jgi:hypothetical protein